MNQAAYNIAIIGQTGVGKSSLINYLFGEKICDTGIGKPVTKNGFHLIRHKINGMPIHLYDSWGVEVGKEEQWKQELNKELNERGIDKSPSEWFHSVFYCIAASGARIQDADIKIIKQLINDKYKVSIILTKADAINEKEEEIFKQEIRKAISSSVEIIAVCSETKKTRNSVTEAFGREELERILMLSAVDSLIERFPSYTQKELEKFLIQWKSEVERVTKNIIFGNPDFDFFLETTDDIVEQLDNFLKKRVELFASETEELVKKLWISAQQHYGQIFKSVHLVDMEFPDIHINVKTAINLSKVEKNIESMIDNMIDLEFNSSNQSEFMNTAVGLFAGLTVMAKEKIFGGKHKKALYEKSQNILEDFEKEARYSIIDYQHGIKLDLERFKEKYLSNF